VSSLTLLPSRPRRFGLSLIAAARISFFFFWNSRFCRNLSPSSVLFNLDGPESPLLSFLPRTPDLFLYLTALLLSLLSGFIIVPGFRLPVPLLIKTIERSRCASSFARTVSLLGNLTPSAPTLLKAQDDSPSKLLRLATQTMFHQCSLFLSPQVPPFSVLAATAAIGASKNARSPIFFSDRQISLFPPPSFFFLLPAYPDMLEDRSFTQIFLSRPRGLNYTSVFLSFYSYRPLCTLYCHSSHLLWQYLVLGFCSLGFVVPGPIRNSLTFPLSVPSPSFSPRSMGDPPLITTRRLFPSSTHPKQVNVFAVSLS